uniref:Uncharacterized protein n=1 Tax=Timema bartmani TaxID=61472 RepID=A0A7R9I6P3_9NEOP|nr:unnamed protein product [Timema bartmani]
MSLWLLNTTGVKPQQINIRQPSRQWRGEISCQELAKVEDKCLSMSTSEVSLPDHILCTTLDVEITSTSPRSSVPQFHERVMRRMIHVTEDTHLPLNIRLSFYHGPHSVLACLNTYMSRESTCFLVKRSGVSELGARKLDEYNKFLSLMRGDIECCFKTERTDYGRDRMERQVGRFSKWM